MSACVVMNLFLAVTVICFPEQFCSFTCYIDGMFQSKFPFKENKVLFYLILSYLILSYLSLLSHAFVQLSRGYRRQGLS